jgi:hypothetical protein
MGIFYPNRRTLDSVAEIVSGADDPVSSWRKVIEFTRANIGGGKLELPLDINAAVSTAAREIDLKWKEEPVPNGIKFFYFGLFDLRLSGDPRDYAGFYISGGEEYDPSDSDSLCKLEYFPENRILRLSFLDSIKEVGKENPSIYPFVDYAVIFGAAAVVAKFSLKSLGQIQKLIVGFDEGDYAEMN